VTTGPRFIFQDENSGCGRRSGPRGSDERSTPRAWRRALQPIAQLLTRPLPSFPWPFVQAVRRGHGRVSCHLSAFFVARSRGALALLQDDFGPENSVTIVTIGALGAFQRCLIAVAAGIWLSAKLLKPAAMLRRLFAAPGDTVDKNLRLFCGLPAKAAEADEAAPIAWQMPLPWHEHCSHL
jgi:hypothetical protein